MYNISFKQYLRLKDNFNYHFLIAIKGKDVVDGFKFNYNLTYFEVRKCLKLLRSVDNLEFLKELFKVCYNCDVFSLRIVSFFEAQNFIVNYFKSILEKESKLLSSNSVDMVRFKEAGSDRLNVFSDLMPLVQLGEIYKVYPYDLQNKPYNEILTLLVAHKTKNEVNKKYYELINKN